MSFRWIGTFKDLLETTPYAASLPEKLVQPPYDPGIDFTFENSLKGDKETWYGVELPSSDEVNATSKSPSSLF